MPKSIRVVHRRVGISNPQQPCRRAAIAKCRHSCRPAQPPSAANSPPSPPLLHNAAPHSSKVWVCLGQVLPNYLEMKGNAYLTVQHNSTTILLHAFNPVPTMLCYVIYYHGDKKYPYYTYFLIIWT